MKVRVTGATDMIGANVARRVVKIVKEGSCINVYYL